MVGGYSQGLNRRKICRQVATPPQSSQEPLHPRFVLSGCKPPTKPVRRVAARQPLSLWQPDEAEVDGGHVTSKFVGERWKRHRRRGVGRGDPPKSNFSTISQLTESPADFPILAMHKVSRFCIVHCSLSL